MGIEIKKDMKPKVNMSPNIALVGVGGMVPSMVRAIEDITSTTNIARIEVCFLHFLKAKSLRRVRSEEGAGLS